ncbi:hypothetical protein [Sutcliffiella halmapala]|uniref:hypothetical protein n=1 Tax=Sutcliffiella halmapala TaxID=79882 RepID=UPI00099514A3|nr:hypothetical protein [Sutcliffiella halmapala]
MLNEEKAREELENILQQKEYQDYYVDTRNTFEILWDKLLSWLAELLTKFFPSLEATSGTAGNILFVVICLVIVTLVIIFIMIMSKHRRDRSIRNQQPFQSENELEWTYYQHLTESKKQETLGDYTLSTRHLFLALLLYFHEKTWLEARIWKTNWEYYEELRKVHKESAVTFFNFALLFDRATYGKQQIQKEEYIPYRNEALKWFGKEQNDVLDERRKE